MMYKWKIKNKTHQLLLYPDWFWLPIFLLKEIAMKVFSPSQVLNYFTTFFASYEIVCFRFLQGWKKLTVKHCGSDFKMNLFKCLATSFLLFVCNNEWNGKWWLLIIKLSLSLSLSLFVSFCPSVSLSLSLSFTHRQLLYILTSKWGSKLSCIFFQILPHFDTKGGNGAINAWLELRSRMAISNSDRNIA